MQIRSSDEYFKFPTNNRRFESLSMLTKNGLKETNLLLWVAINSKNRDINTNVQTVGDAYSSIKKASRTQQ